jgi:putative ABC transport system ATP-binding protein
MDAVFALKGISFKDILALDSLDFPLHAVSCILGKSGSGKTTLLRMLNRTVLPDSGTIHFMGDELGTINPIALRRRVALLGQNPVVFPGTVEDNLRIGLRFAGRPEAPAEAFQAVLDAVHLDKALDMDPANFSGGEKQRLALARILLIDPDVLLLDEPTAALDEHTERSVFQHIITAAAGKRIATIMVTHSRWVADAFADYLVQIVQGRVQESRFIRRGHT